MTDSLAQARLAVDFSHLGKLRAQARTDQQQAAGQAAREFETLFIRQMLKTMRDSLPEDSLFSSSDMRLYQDWFDQQIAQQIGQRGELGLADFIQKQLAPPSPAQGHKTLPLTAADWLGRKVEPVKPSPPSNVEASPKVERKAVSQPAPASDWRQGPEQFVKGLLPYASKAAQVLGVHPGLLLAQAALETGWGRHLPGDGAGQQALNLFGIKAGHNWQGRQVVSETKEVHAGQWQQEQAAFRDFPDLQSAFDGLVDFLRGNPRYAPVLQQAREPEAWARGLQQAGYATDPDYADKLLDIFQRPDFRRWVEEGLKLTGFGPINRSEPAL